MIKVETYSSSLVVNINKKKKGRRNKNNKKKRERHVLGVDLYSRVRKDVKVTSG